MILRRLYSTMAIAFWAVSLSACTSNTPLSPTPTIAFASTAQVLQAAGDLQQAVAVWEQALAANPDNPAANYQLGLLLAVLEAEAAPEYLEKAADLDDSYSEPARRILVALRQARFVDSPAYQSTLVGQALASVEEWRLAQAALLRATQADPEYAEAWAYLGEVQQQNGEDGLPALQTAYQLNSNSYAANVFLGLYWRRNNQPQRALPYLQNAVQIEPDNLAILQDLANTLVAAGLVEEGLAKMEAHVETSPDDGARWLLLAQFCIENEFQIEETGLHAARQAVLLMPDSSEALTLLGRAYMLTGEALLAERFLTEASQQAPESGTPHLYLGLLYLNTGDMDSAKTHLQNAVRLAEQAGETLIGVQANDLLDKFFP